MVYENNAGATATETPVEPTRISNTFRPPVDILERPDEVLILADLPGVEPDDLDIEFENKALTIRGHVKPRQADDLRYLFREYGVGDFYRVFQVTEDVDPRRISAELKDGVLSLHLPKAEAAKPRKISVQVSN
jgi:HSP20 family protein